MVRAVAPWQAAEKIVALGTPRRVYIVPVGSQNGISNVRASEMAASKRNRSALAPLKILFCAALFVATFVVYGTVISFYAGSLPDLRIEVSSGSGDRDHSESRSTPDDPYATPEPTPMEKFHELVLSFLPSPHPSTQRYAIPESANIEPPAVPCTAVQCGTSYPLDRTSPHFSTQDSYATPDFKRIEEEDGKRDGDIAKAKKEATPSQATPPRVREVPPKAISPTDADLTVADLNGVHDAVADPTDAISSDVEPSVPAVQATAFQAPAVPAPAVNIPAFQGPAFRVPAFQGPAYRVPTFQTPAVPPCCVAR
jgi:hypothetical protein